MRKLGHANAGCLSDNKPAADGQELSTDGVNLDEPPENVSNEEIRAG